MLVINLYEAISKKGTHQEYTYRIVTITFFSLISTISLHSGQNNEADRALALMMKNNYHEAIEAYEKLIANIPSQDPKNTTEVHALMNYGQCL